MCEFFSFITNGCKKTMYFLPEDINKIYEKDNPQNYQFNSHDSIASFYGFNTDKCNKYEYNPYTKEFTIDQINSRKDDSEYAEKWVKDFFKEMTTTQIKTFHKNYLPKINYKR